MNETLSRLGFTLQQDFQSWLSHVADLDFHTALVDQSTGFDRLTQELVACEQIGDAFFEIEAWLTSGFLPGESDAVVVSPEELFAQSPIDRPRWKREERDRSQKPLSETVTRVTSDRHQPIPEAISKNPQPARQDDFHPISLRQPSITPTVVEPALLHPVDDWTTAGITEPARTVFPTSQNPLKGIRELATFLQEERSAQTDFTSPVYLEVDRDQATWPLSSNSVTNVNWPALKEDEAIVVAGAGPLNPPILGDFELGEMARLPQDWGLGGESTQADFTSPVNLKVDRDQISWPLSSNSVTDLDWQALKEDRAIVATGAGPLNPPFLNAPSGYILGDFEPGEMAGTLNSPILEDFETNLAQKSPRIGGLGGNSAGPLNSPTLEDFATNLARKSPRIEGLGGDSAGPLNSPIPENFETNLARKSPRIGGLGGGSAESVGSISRFDITAQPEVPPIDFDTLLEALQQEINQDYHRFYGS
jgi:hypothetical protein